jgi:acyl carrier protein
MDELEARVLECFANVFPGIPRERLARLSQAASAEWDSVMHVTLLAALGEEFGFEIDFEVAEELRSFALVANYVRDHVGR